MNGRNVLAIITGAALAVSAGCQRGDNDSRPSGTLEATQTDIASTLPGRVIWTGFQLGDEISAGDTLVRLDTDLLELELKKAAAGRRTIDAQRAVVANSLEQANIQLRFAESTLARISALADQGSITQHQLDEATLKRDLAATQINAAKRQLKALNAEEARLDAALAVLERQIAEGVIIAPTDGTVLLKNVEIGEIVQPGMTLLRIGDLNTMEMRIFLGVYDLGKIELGEELPVWVDSYPDKRYSGRVVWISPSAEFTPRNVQTPQSRLQLVYAVKIAVPNPDKQLHIGMTAEAELN